MGERLKNLLTATILLVLYAGNRFLWEDFSLIVRFVTLFAVLFHAWLLGKALLPRKSAGLQAIFGIMLFFSVFAVTQTAWFYAGLPLDATADYWTLLTAMMLSGGAYVFSPESDSPNEEAPRDTWDLPRVLSIILLSGVVGTALTFVAVSAWRASTGASIRTPWPILPPDTLIALALLWIAIPLSAWLVRSRVYTAITGGIAMFALTSIAPIVYRLGFGFDGFLHVAGEQQILLTGTLNPKPLYYIGQYVFTTWLTRITEIPVLYVDRWLVPVAAALFIPLTLYLATRHESRIQHTLSFLALALLPLAPFVATTPQSFSYILGFCAILLATAPAQDVLWPAPLLLAGWATAVHPLAGIPFFGLSLALLFARTNSRFSLLRYILAGLSAFGAAASVPTLFFILSSTGGTHISWNLASLASWQPWQTLFSALTPWIGNAFVLWPAWATLVQQSLLFFILLLAIGTIVILPKTRRAPYIFIVVTSLLFIASGAILKAAGDFAFLIDYERGNYADRMIILATFGLVAASIPALTKLFERARTTPSFFSVLLLISFGALASAQSYNALPRNDALVTGHGWSVGTSDVEATHDIDQDAGSTPYTVLANQSVSAAAVSQFGFKRYNGDVFYYPIPTGGPLYETYLRMTYKDPSRDTAKDAASLGGSQLVYVVVNDYWWNAEQLSAQLASIADRSWTIGDPNAGFGHVVNVYKFDFSTSSTR